MKLLSPKTDVSRPITDRVKESLFSVLYKYGLPKDKIVADLFCGVGSLGLEAVSRGAKFTLFVERDPCILDTLNKNREKACFIENTKVIRANAFKIGAPVKDHEYDLVFVDPPYRMARDVRVESRLGQLLVTLTGQLAEDGIVVVRTERDVELLQQYGQLEMIERRRWGTMAVAILKKAK
jgi:16S rRNA (guanine966-N2)-methyltransferase